MKFTTLLAALLLACTSSTAPPNVPAPAEGTGGEEAEDTVWLAGTPFYYPLVEGYGWMPLMHTAPAPEGPWTTAWVRLPPGVELAVGTIHRVEMRAEDMRGVQDDVGGEVLYHVEAIHESRSGGPPVEVVQGVHAAGVNPLPVGVVPAGFADASWDHGCFRADAGYVEFEMSCVQAIQVGDTVLRAGDTPEAIAGAFEGCERAGGRGATVFRCTGAEVRLDGLNAPEHTRVRILPDQPARNAYYRRSA